MSAALAMPDPAAVASPAPATPGRELTNVQRAAIVLVSLGPEHASALAELLGMDAMRRIRQTLTDLPQVRQADILSTMATFMTHLDNMRDGLRGGEREAARLLGDVLNEALVKEIMTTETPKDPDASAWAAYAELKPVTIAEFVGRQHGAVAAILLHKLPADLVPEVLGLMPPDVAVEAIGLMSRADDPSEAAIMVARRLVERELLTSASDPASDPKVILIGETLGTLPRDLRDAALERLDAEDAERAAAIRATLLRVEDLPARLPTRAIQTVFKEMPREVLIRALAAMRSQAPDVSDFLLGNIAQRMAETYREDIASIEEMDGGAQDRAIGIFVREMLGLARRDVITLLPPPKPDTD